MASPLPASRQSISISDLVLQADRAVQMVGEVRSRMLAPDRAKTPPTFTLTQLASLCGIDKSQISYRLTKGDLPTGVLNATGSRREFSLMEARQWVRA